MRVAELTAPHQFRLVEKTIVDPGPGEIQVRMEAVGICGSDLHYYSEGAIGDTPCVFPMVMGHEPAGVVVKAGSGVTGWSPGDRVFCEPAIYCYHCESCRTGHHNVCTNIRFLSMPQDPGFFRESVNLPAGNLLPIPPTLDAAHATLIEPLAVALHSMKFAQIEPADTAVVFGAGPIGLLTIAALRLAGAGRIWAVDPVSHRLELARHVGADAVIDPKSVDPVRQVQADTGKRGVDVAIDCAARDGSINQCAHAVRNAGRMVITGISSEAEVALDFSPIRRKELAIFNVRRSNHESQAALELLTGHLAVFAPIVTHTRPLEAISEAFAELEHYDNGVGKSVILPTNR